MTNFTRMAKLFLCFGFTLLLAAACSSPKYYVYKTIKHTPIEKTDTTKEQQAIEESDKLAIIVPEEIVPEEAAYASTEKVTEAANLEKISQQLNQKATAEQGKKPSKLQEIKTALQVKKEIKKMQKELESQGDMSQEDSTQQGSGKSQLIALLLAIFLGGFGVHRFYLGYTWQGIVQILLLLTSWLILPGIALLVWLLIDIIRIATGDLGPKGAGGYTEEL